MSDSARAPAPPQPLSPSTPADRFQALAQLGAELGVDPHRLRAALLKACYVLDDYEDEQARRQWLADGGAP